MAISREKDFELKITVIVSGFGKQTHWAKLAKTVKRILAVHMGECYVACDEVRVPGGKWYDCSAQPGLGFIPPFDYEAGD